MSFWCFQIFQKTNENFSWIAALASKKKSNQKSKGTIYWQLENFILTLTILFWFDLFLLGQKSWKICDCFLEDLKAPKGHFEIKWPLTRYVISCSFVKLLHFSRKKYFEGRIFQGPKRSLVLFFILPFIRHLETAAATTLLYLYYYGR